MICNKHKNAIQFDQINALFDHRMPLADTRDANPD